MHRKHLKSKHFSFLSEQFHFSLVVNWKLTRPLHVPLTILQKIQAAWDAAILLIESEAMTIKRRMNKELNVKQGEGVDGSF